MKCWICGEVASSGEHMIKASDLRSTFGPVTQDAPLYFSTAHSRNVRVPGIRSNTLKYTALLCARCNNERTQSHDKAWERLSAYLRSRNPSIRRGTDIRLHKVFPGAVHKSMLGVHLYFAKLFGCLIVQNGIPIDIAPFSKAILTEEPHPTLFLGLWANLALPSVRHVGQTQVNTAQLNGHIVYATWFYFVERAAINVIFAEPWQRRKGLVYAWHPSNMSKHLHVRYET